MFRIREPMVLTINGAIKQTVKLMKYKGDIKLTANNQQVNAIMIMYIQ